MSVDPGKYRDLMLKIMGDGPQATGILERVLDRKGSHITLKTQRHPFFTAARLLPHQFTTKEPPMKTDETPSPVGWTCEECKCFVQMDPNHGEYHCDPHCSECKAEDWPLRHRQGDFPGWKPKANLAPSPVGVTCAECGHKVTQAAGEYVCRYDCSVCDDSQWPLYLEYLEDPEDFACWKPKQDPEVADCDVCGEPVKRSDKRPRSNDTVCMHYKCWAGQIETKMIEVKHPEVPRTAGHVDVCCTKCHTQPVRYLHEGEGWPARSNYEIHCHCLSIGGHDTYPEHWQQFACVAAPGVETPIAYRGQDGLPHPIGSDEPPVGGPGSEEWLTVAELCESVAWLRDERDSAYHDWKALADEATGAAIELQSVTKERNALRAENRYLKQQARLCGTDDEVRRQQFLAEAEKEHWETKKR